MLELLKRSLALSIPTKDKLLMLKKIKFYISKQKICLTNEIHGNSFAYKKQMKEESFSTGKPKKNMHKSLYLSMALRIIPK